MRTAAPRYAAAVFDMDGLLLDSERPVRAAWMDASAEFGAPLDAANYLTLVGLNHRDSQRRLLALFGDDPALLGAVHARAQALLEERFEARGFDPKPGAVRLLGGLRRAGVACAVASSTAHQEVRRRLGRAGLLECFDVVCGGDEVQRGKPDPQLYALALQRLGRSAQVSLAFEDSGHGAESALAAGLAVVAVPDLRAPEAATLARCLAVLPSLEAVVPHGGAWFGQGFAVPP